MAKRKKKQPISYSFLKVLTGSDLSSRRLAVMEAKTDKTGPSVWLTACVHGDEVGGIAVIQEIFKRLKKWPLKEGSLHAFPLMNPIGFENASRNLPLSEEDLNRSFPGNPLGALAERVADKIFTTILETKPALVVDLHNDWIRSIPYTLVDPNPGKEYAEAYKKTIEFSKLAGFLVINEQEEAKEAEELKHSLSGSLLLSGVPALTLELGGSYVIDETDVEEGVSAVWNILANLNMVEGMEWSPAYFIPEEARGKILKYSHQPTAQKSGLLRALSKPGHLAKKGEPIARIYNVFGKLEETIHAERDCVILGYSDSAAAMPGEPIMSFGIIEGS